MSGKPIGRDREIDVIERVLGSNAGGPAAISLLGEPGIGKSTLWRRAVSEARARGYRMLVARPTEAEVALAYGALADLLTPCVEEGLLERLPPLQRQALAVALQREMPSGASPPALAIAIASTTILRLAAAERPTIVAIDDVPWVDSSSASVLAFVARRLESSRVTLIGSYRTASGGEPVTPLVLESGPSEVLSLSGLDRDGIDSALRTELGLALPHPALDRIHGVSGGNPLYALEIGRSLVARGGLPRLDTWSLPESLRAMVRDRLAGVPSSTASVALAVAAASRPTVRLLHAACGRRVATTGIASGVEAGIFVLDNEVLRFAHPLLGAERYASASPAERHRMHRRLSRASGDSEERGMHLARSARPPDARIAMALDEAYAAAYSRGASAAAAVLAEEAARFTPDEDAFGREERLLEAGRLHLLAGDADRSRTFVSRFLATVPSGPRRARGLAVLADVAKARDRLAEADAIYREAIEHAHNDVALRTGLYMGMAAIRGNDLSAWDEAYRYAAEAHRIAEAAGDPALDVLTVGDLALFGFRIGIDRLDELMELGAALEPWADRISPVDHPDSPFATILATLGELDEARRRLERLIDRARRQSDLLALPWLLGNLGHAEVDAGNWTRALELFEEKGRILLQTADTHDTVHHGRLRVFAHRGQVEEARAAAGALFASLARSNGAPITDVIGSLCLLELSLGDFDAAHRAFERYAGSGTIGMREPAIAGRLVSLEVEALVGLGRLDDADRLLTWFERLAEERDRAVAIAVARRSRGWLQAAQGDMEAALASLQEAVERYRELPLPFERARALLMLGSVRRRSRQKASTRAALDEALAAFEHLGARLWADQARAELSRVAGSDRGLGQLTPTQSQVADLVAQGLPNRQVAERLFMSVHTVEYHLTAIYRSLGIRSRTELARRRAGAGSASVPESTAGRVIPFPGGFGTPPEQRGRADADEGRRPVIAPE